MKKGILPCLIFLLLLTLVSCKEDPEDPSTPTPAATGISYPDSIPDSVYFGRNILSFPDSTVLVNGTDYEMGAVLEADASLKLVITNFPETDTSSGMQTVWFYSDEIGWVVTDYDEVNDRQTFISGQSGKIDLKIVFMAFGVHGSCRIDFYENSETITRVKHFSWE